MTATVTVDREGIVIGWNEETVGLLGYPESHAVGRAMDFFIPEEYRDMHWEGFRGAMASGTLKFAPTDILPVEMTHHNGTRLPIDVTVLPLRDAAGRIISLTATLKLRM
ncbi:MAG TPA: PAS domain-containing protein [Pseudorhodoplanes sp.]|nr:PAS domain-containing protein [Pseudorhodoplanes sp.]